MYFYEVAPTDRNYHGQDLLTYSHDSILEVGQIVVVTVQTKSCSAFVVNKANKPSFSTKPISHIINDVVVPANYIKLFEWIRDYYPAPLGLVASLFVPPMLDITKLPIESIAPNTFVDSGLPPLTDDQTKAIKAITSSDGTVILHGDTGTGKTRVYLELTREAVKSGESVLVLTPEIALTPQLVAVFKKHLPGVQVFHSQQTAVTRRNLWISINTSRGPQVVIGPRSALFLPIKNLGLIVLDEFHDGSYKNEQAPSYHGLRVASKLASDHNARLVLGSATPPVTEYYYGTKKKLPVVRMTQKALTTSISKTLHKVVDLTDKDELSGLPLLSNTLLKNIEGALDRKEQALIFLNKRGSARLLVCQNCGWKSTCDNCDLPLVYHLDGHRMRCHTCGTTKPAPHSCPECQSSDITFKSPGTKAIVESLSKRFPNASIARFDRDNTTSERLEQRHQEVVDGSIDILVGTQLLAKGHDLPRLSLVGIVLADGELSFPDYSSEERSYQLIHQLAGRVGRGHREGTVVIQTYNPNGISIKAVDHANSWQDFYDAQIKERKQFGFPPFYHTLKIEAGRAKPANAESAIRSIETFIRQHFSRVELVGPSPSFIAKRNNKYSWQLIVKAKNRQLLVDISRSVPVKSTADIDPLHLL